MLFHIFRDPSCLNLKNIMGFILNIPSDYKFGFITIPLRRRHWIALRLLDGLYYNLDSKLDMPTPIGEVSSNSFNRLIINCRFFLRQMIY